MRNNKSIYEYLREHIEKNGLINMQEPIGEIWGKSECEILFIQDYLDIFNKRKIVGNIINLITINEIPEKTFTIIEIYFVLIDKLQVYLQAGIIDEENLYYYGMELCKKSTNKEVVKLGLAILRVVKERSEILELARDFSVSNEYLFYSLEIFRNYSKSNELVLEVAKRSTGIGRLFALERLEPLDDNIKTWLVQEGSNNDILNSTLAEIIVNGGSLKWYVDRYRSSKARFRVISNLLFYLYESSNEFKALDRYCSKEKYKRDFGKYGEEIKELYILSKGVEEDLDDYIGNKEFWINKVKEEFNRDRYSVYILIELAELLEIPVELEAIKTLLDNHRLNAKLYKYIIENITLNEIEEFIEITEGYISNKVVNKNGKVFYEDNVSEDIIEDICFYMIVYSMYIAEIDNRKLIIKALVSRYVPTVNIAIKIIKNKKIVFNEEELKYIRNTVNNIKDDRLKRNILRVITVSEDNCSKIKTVTVRDVKVKPHLKDIKLKNLRIAGSEYRDIESFSDLIKEDSIVYLKRERDNIYDKRAILVLTKEGYSLGYIPRGDNEILSSMLDGDIKLYGILTHIDEDYREIRIDIILSYRYILKEINTVLNMITKSKNEYLN